RIEHRLATLRAQVVDAGPSGGGAGVQLRPVRPQLLVEVAPGHGRDGIRRCRQRPVSDSDPMAEIDEVPYEAPDPDKTAFNCPSCRAYSSMVRCSTVAYEESGLKRDLDTLYVMFCD